MFIRSLLEVVRTILYGWIVALVRLLRALFRRPKDGRSERDRRASSSPCVPIDDPAFVRPDPLIYSQQKLMSLGLAVTWDNPDIVLFHEGVAVSSHALQPDTLYEVRSRIWNDSFDAPVIDMTVHLSYLDFGIGTTPIPVGSAKVDVGVKGAPNQPAFVSIPWRTPDHPGHYCLQVLLDPIEDRDSSNNLGQENTDVGVAASPVAFKFRLRNGGRRSQRYRFEVDAYELRRQPCRPGEDARRERLEHNRRGQHPIPAGFNVDIAPQNPTLAPDETVDVDVTITPPDGFVGSQRFNVNAFDEHGPAGGVTLTVIGEG